MIIPPAPCAGTSGVALGDFGAPKLKFLTSLTNVVTAPLNTSVALLNVPIVNAVAPPIAPPSLPPEAAPASAASPIFLPKL